MTTLDSTETAAGGEPHEPRRSLWYRLYHGETGFDFVGRRKIGFAISLVLLLVTVGSLLGRQLNLGIDFEGGVSWEFSANGLSSDDASSILGDNGIDERDAKIQELSGTDGVRLRVQTGDQPPEVETAVRDAFAEATGVPAEDVSVSTVSPTWGEQITKKALTALVVFFLLIAAYISWRFEWKMAIAALAAVVHDIGISVGVYSVFGFEVTPATVIAFLTILGFSLYDTIVVFDKVHENEQRMGTRVPYGDIVNLSMNQVLMRSLNTSIAAVLPVLSVLVIGSEIMGALALQDFALALLVGLITGSYSSIFIATPILAILKEREPKYRAVKQRRANAAELGQIRHRVAPTTTGARNPVARQPGDHSPVDPAAALTHPPRPRKKRRR
ncbi:MAG: protein translocase subunit SecF [Acidimicrobiia bacterium]